jgi:hypothetical protein
MLNKIKRLIRKTYKLEELYEKLMGINTQKKDSDKTDKGIKSD